MMGANTGFPVAPPALPTAPIMLYSGPAEYFARHDQPDLGDPNALDRIAAKAQSLRWIKQHGALGQSRITVEGKAFDLSCGCRLPVGQ